MLIASPVKAACIASDIIAIQHQSTTPKEDNNMKAIGPISQIRRKRVIAGLATLSIMLAGQSLAHSGGLDSRGCHAGTQPYHCHRDRSSFNWKLLIGLLVLGSIIQSSEDSSQGNKSTKSMPVDRTDILEILQRYSGRFSDESAAIKN